VPNDFLRRIADVDERTGHVRAAAFGRHRGGTKTTTVIRDTDGRVGGTTTEHWDDRVDARVTKFDVVKNPRWTPHIHKETT